MSEIGDLNDWEWDVVARLFAREARRLKKRHERSTFVPEPGHVDMSLVKITTTETILGKARANRNQLREEQRADDHT
jgi:hypothetical protein